MNATHSRWKDRQARQAAEIAQLERDLSRSYDSMAKADSGYITEISTRASKDVLARAASSHLHAGVRASVPLAAVYWVYYAKTALGWFCLGAFGAWLLMR